MKGKNEVVLLTGASSGIGLATAVFLAERRYRVHAGIRNPDKQHNLINEVDRKKLPISIVYFDILNNPSIEKAISEILRKEGRIDVLINNAGYGLRGFFEDCSMEEMKMQFDTNFFGTMSMIKHVLPVMRKQNYGRIINVSSIYAEFPFPMMSVYSATKFAIEAITSALRLELFPFNIQVSTIQPSGIRTNFEQSAVFSKESREEHSPYFKFNKHFIEKFSMDSAGLSPDIVAAKIYKIIRSANNKIVLIDNFIDESVLDLFTKRKTGVEFIIYTKNITKLTALDAHKFSQQYGNVQLKEFNQSHDRFLIIDNKDVYILGRQ